MLVYNQCSHNSAVPLSKLLGVKNSLGVFILCARPACASTLDIGKCCVSVFSAANECYHTC